MAGSQSKIIFSITRPAARDLSSYRYHVMKLDSSEDVDYVDTSAGSDALGVLQNAPSAAGQEAQIGVLGTSIAVGSGSISTMDKCGSNSAYRLAAVTATKARYICHALEDVTANGDYLEVNLLGGTNFITA